MKILAIIPARSKSKGLINKNIKKINSIPLLAYAGLLTKECSFITKTVISTDSKLYQRIANKYNIESPFLRPENLSGDFISDIEVLSHALIESEKYYSQKFDYIIMLQPTAPFRNVDLIKNCILKLKSENLDSVWTISRIDKKFSPLKQLIIDENNNITLFDKKGRNIIARQQLKETYIRNGQCYCFTRDTILKYFTIMPPKTGFILTPNYPNIDDLNDFNIAKKNLNIFLNNENL